MQCSFKYFEQCISISYVGKNYVHVIFIRQGIILNIFFGFTLNSIFGNRTLSRKSMYFQDPNKTADKQAHQ